MDEFYKNFSIKTENIASTELLKVFSIKELIQIKMRKKFELELKDVEDIDDIRNQLLFDDTVQEYLQLQEKEGITEQNIYNGVQDHGENDIFYD